MHTTRRHSLPSSLPFVTQLDTLNAIWTLRPNPRTFPSVLTPDIRELNVREMWLNCDRKRRANRFALLLSLRVFSVFWEGIFTHRCVNPNVQIGMIPGKRTFWSHFGHWRLLTATTYSDLQRHLVPEIQHSHHNW